MATFSHLTVLSLEQATTLPYLTLRLAQEGMRVIRVENPPRGDPNRWIGAPVLAEEGMNAYFLPNNLGKESITLDLASDQGRTMLHGLIQTFPVDIFATNQRPKDYAKLGIDYATLSALKPELIWVGITGFGPDSNEAAYDPVIQARAGWMDMTGEPDGLPVVFGLPMVDLGAGEQGYGQVMRALYERERTGQGSRVDLSLWRSALSWMVSPLMLTKTFGERIARRGNSHQFFAPVSVYPTRDGFLYLAVGNDRQWESIVRTQEFAALAREEYRQNAGRLAAVAEVNRGLAAVTATRDTREWVEFFRPLGVPVSAVNTLRDVVADPSVNEHLITARDPRTGLVIHLPAPAVLTDFLRESGLSMTFPPRLGEHNDTVLGSK